MHWRPTPALLLGAVACVPLAACSDVVVNESDTSAPTDVSPTPACTDASDCNDGGSCRTASCDGGTCSYTLLPDNCFVDGVCYAAGQEAPGDRCRHCDPGSVTNALVAKPCAEGQTCSPSTGECEGETGSAFGTACTEDSECLARSCVPTPDGRVCTQACDDAAPCPGEWECGSAGVCVHPAAELCKPCNGDNECTVAGALGDAFCTELAPGEGRFCSIGCGDGGACPSGYECRSVDRGGNGVDLCIPAAGAGCSCSDWAIEQGASTTCALGECGGTRTCGAGGLSDCDAQGGVAEVCDNLDNDCDGETDEDFRTGGQYVDPDHCGSCDQSCDGAVANGTATCTADSGTPACVLDTCNPGFVEGPPGECSATTDIQCAPCTNDSQCQSGLSCQAVGDVGGQFCVQPCTIGGAPCGTGFDCQPLVQDGPTYCLLAAGGCAAQGTPCDADSTCEDLNPCTTGTCTNSACNFAPDNSYFESCYEGPEGTLDVGACVQGTRGCSDGVLGDCIDQIVPGPEVCGDGGDDDCDGTDDEGCDFVGFDMTSGGLMLSGPVGGGMTLDATLAGQPEGGPAPAVDAPFFVEFGLYLQDAP